MLLTVSGSSCSGKTTTVRSRVWHDFEDIDTTGRTVQESAAELSRWIDGQRQPANQDIA